MMAPGIPGLHCAPTWAIGSSARWASGRRASAASVPGHDAHGYACGRVAGALRLAEAPERAAPLRPQMSKYIANSHGWGRWRRASTSWTVLYQIHVSITSSVKTSPRRR